MKLENRELANAICEEITMLDAIVENLQHEPLLIGVKKLQEKPFLILPTKGDSDLFGLAATFVNDLITMYSSKRRILQAELEQL